MPILVTAIEAATGDCSSAVFLAWALQHIIGVSSNV
jgi:hypothetical protein